MSYAIVGSGHVGRALAKAFARKGMEVALTSRRSPEELAPIATAIGPTIAAKSLRDALKAEVILLAVPFNTYQNVAEAAESWDGKTVIDVTNAYGVPPETLGNRPSSAAIAEAMPGASLVKAFNHLPAKVLEEDPENGTGRRVLFLSSDHEEAMKRVADLVEQLGFAPVPLGKLAEGGLLIHASGNSWGPLIFQDLFKRSQ